MMIKQTTLSILVYFILACGISFGFSRLPTLNVLSVDSKDILCGFGPLLSGVICYLVFKTPTSYSIGGKQSLKTWLIVLISVSSFVFTNTKNNVGFNIVFGFTQLVYCFGEEYGWRHYLQSATCKLSGWLQYLIIGTAWFGWHFSWLPDPVKARTGQNMHAPVAAVVISTIFALSLISFFLGWVINKTQSVMLPATLHFASKTNIFTTVVTLTVLLIVVLTWNKFFFPAKHPSRTG